MIPADEQVRKRPKVALPSQDEQKQLQQVETLMQSNLLGLQVDELLVEVDGDAKLQKKKLQKWILLLKEALAADSSMAGTELSGSWLKKQRKKHGLSLRLSNEEDPSLKLQYEKPASLSVDGSSATHTSTSPYLNVDIAVCMPSSAFDSRDILNHRYFDKRKLYLAGLCRALVEDEQLGLSAADMQFAAFKGDANKPLLLFPCPAAPHICVRLIPAVADGVFKHVQLRANKSNVRAAEGDSASTSASARFSPTPLYNLAILEDMALLMQHGILQKSLTAAPALAQALVLFKVWLTQRGLRFRADGFDGHHAGLLLAYLLQTRRVSASSAGGSGALSAFQAALTFIAEGQLLQSALDFTATAMKARDGWKDGVLAADSSVSVSAADCPGLQHTAALDEDVMWDYLRPLQLAHPISSGGGAHAAKYNCLWRVSSSAALQLQGEARRSLQELRASHEHSCFQHLFMQGRSFFESHDQFFSFKVPHSVTREKVLKLKAEDGERTEGTEEEQTRWRGALTDVLLQCGPPALHFAARAQVLLRQGLGDRVAAVHATVSPLAEEGGQGESAPSAHLPAWGCQSEKSVGVGAAGTEGAVDYLVSLGVVLSKERLDRRVDKGPAAQEGSDMPEVALDPALQLFSCMQAQPEQPASCWVGMGGELARFRELWGSRVQLRRFKDGAILDAVVWDAPSRAQSSSGKGGVPEVVEQVSRFLLGRHLGSVCGAEGRGVRAVTSQLEDLLQTVDTQGGVLSAIEEEAMGRRAVEALDRLRRLLTSQLTLPLGIDSVMAVAPALRYSSALPPRPHPFVSALSGEGVGAGEAKAVLRRLAGQSVSRLVPPLRVLLQLETSGKWPKNDPEAVRQSKTALLLHLRKELQQTFTLKSVIHRDSLDVLFEGFVFRLQPMATQEVEAAVREADEAGAKVMGAGGGMQQVVQELVVPALHHQQVRALRAQHPSFSGTVRLLLCWTAQHCFSGHLCLELLELVAAAEYLHPHCAQAPASSLAGFYRALLRLSEHNWDADPLVVDLSGEGREVAGSAAVQLDIVTKFRAAREAGSPSSSSASSGEGVDGAAAASLAWRRSMNVPMYVVSSADKALGYWPALAERSPERVVLLEYLQAQGTEEAGALQEVLGLGAGGGKGKGSASVGASAASAVLSKCDVVLRFHKALVNTQPSKGPPFARLEVFANTPESEAALSHLVVL
jgi:U3 small nucleolar RNA-associated protein 22